MIHIVDYQMGNLRSVQKAFERLGAAAEICDSPERLDRAEKLVLPGVGAFRDAIAALRERGLIEPIRAHIESGRPFLGICLGLQLLFDTSYEDGQWPGLGVIPGEVVRFPLAPDLKVPHMGWNRVARFGPSRVLEGIPEEAHFYFVHSFYVVPRDDSLVAGRTQHGVEFVSAIERENLFATQFHPEKSQRAGLKLLENFAAL
ncbi:MAG: imidazole glycerol phosphate synthase subunit HisH [Planctomycetes bacterium]|nr:imidazole glycerol phosphate synthase subunit HisH [Planctomycetota bacterium]